MAGFAEVLASGRRFGARALMHVMMVFALALSSAAAHGFCVGDCRGDNKRVTIDELLTGVDALVTGGDPASCPDFDADESGNVAINEVIIGINNALHGCEPTPSCVLGSSSQIILNTSLPPLPLDALGTLDVACGEADPGTGNAPCTCNVVQFEPLDIPGIGFVCITPFAGCEAGHIDCDGGSNISVDLNSNRNIGTCTSNSDCNDQCQVHCQSLGKVPTLRQRGCEGFCDGGDRDGLPCNCDSAAAATCGKKCSGESEHCSETTTVCSGGSEHCSRTITECSGGSKHCSRTVTSPCSQDSDCPARETCTSSCKADEECAAGETCVLNVCSEDGDCPGSEKCTSACTADDQCAAEQTCVLNVCSEDGNCPAGETCTSACTADDECTAGETCVPNVGECPNGSCNGQDGAGFGAICECQCVDRAIGPATGSGGFRCNLGVSLIVEKPTLSPCIGDPLSRLITVGSSCVPMTTDTATSILHNANNGKHCATNTTIPCVEDAECEIFLAGDTCVDAFGPFVETGHGIECTALAATERAKGMQLRGVVSFFGSSIGDIATRVNADCR